MNSKTLEKNNKIIITGAAGFIGYHLCKKLLNLGYKIICIDNLNDYYDVKLKEARLKELYKISENLNNSFELYRVDIENLGKLKEIFSSHTPRIIYHLAAQAGVRYSLINPSSYIQSNIVGFGNILELSRIYKIHNLIYASSSSVYGGNHKIPFSEKDPVNHPVSLYAATKKSNELMAHCYSHLFKIPTIGLRFFTVYGPWGRPDMAPMIFAKSIFSKKPLKIFNYGEMERDFTYIDDVIEILVNLISKPASENKKFDRNFPESSSSWAPYRIFNVGNSKKVKLMDFIEILENQIGIEAIKEFEPMQLGDVKSTSAETTSIQKYTNIKPNTNIEKGIKEFVSWYRFFYKIKKDKL